MQEIPCHICESRNYQIFGQPGRNRIVICNECGLFYVNPIPGKEDLTDYVRRSDIYTQDQLDKIDFFKKRAEILLKQIEEIQPPGKLLDIGCAIGTELNVARDRGWDVTGIELSDSSIQIAREKNLHIINRILENSELPDNSFDLITMNHVLEHVTSISSLFHEIQRILRQKGLLFISIPNAKAWPFYLKREHFGWAFHEDHYIFFTMDTLKRLLEKFGFQILTVRTSRFIDFHDELKDHSSLFRYINQYIESKGLGLEIFCLAQLIK